MTDWGGIKQLARPRAAAASLPLDLVLGIIQTESSGRAGAWNPEPPYRYMWNVLTGRPFRELTPAEIASEYPPADFPSPKNVPADAEWWGQQASWGLMQVMGGVAREQGFKGEFHTDLCEPGQGLDHGIRRLATCLRRFGTIERAVAAYNAGTPRRDASGAFRNQGYVDKVLKARAAWTAALGAQGGST